MGPLPLYSFRFSLPVGRQDLLLFPFSLFHCSLKTGGYLFLGSSEAFGEASDLFSAFGRKWILYRRKERGPGITVDHHMPRLPYDRAHNPDMGSLKTTSRLTYREAAEKIMLDMYSPAGVMINEKNEKLYVPGFPYCSEYRHKQSQVIIGIHPSARW